MALRRFLFSTRTFLASRMATLSVSAGELDDGVYRVDKASVIRLLTLNPLLPNVPGYGMFLHPEGFMIASECSANHCNRCTSSSPHRRVNQSQMVKG